MDGDGVFIATPPEGERLITGLTSDSREVKPGFLFAALAGTRTDGARFVADAVASASTFVGNVCGK